MIQFGDPADQLTKTKKNRQVTYNYSKIRKLLICCTITKDAVKAISQHLSDTHAHNNKTQ